MATHGSHGSHGTHDHEIAGLGEPRTHASGHDHDDHGHRGDNHGQDHPQHGHDHAHGLGGHHHHHASGSVVGLSLTLALTLGYFVVEVVMGLWTGSLALLADAGHMLTDGGALVLSLVTARIALRPRSASKTYGYRRAEVIGAMVNASSMIVISLFVVIEAVQRLRAPTEVHGQGLMVTALCGLLVNLLAAVILARTASSSMNVRGALLHVIGDALGSVAALIAGACVVFFHFELADPIASVLISLVLIVGSFQLLRDAANVLMESTPDGLDTAALERTILGTPGVGGVHDLHVWSLTPTEPVLTAHVVLLPAAHGTDVAKRVGERLQAMHGLGHVTIQPEPPPPELIALRIPHAKKKV